jgi:DNA-binding XRE family transcriptional regulator
MGVLWKNKKKQKKITQLYKFILSLQNKTQTMKQIHPKTPYQQQLIKLRKEAGLTQKSLAELMDVSIYRVIQIENPSHSPNLETMEKYAAACQKQLHLIYTDIGKKLCCNCMNFNECKKTASGCEDYEAIL